MLPARRRSSGRCRCGRRRSQGFRPSASQAATPSKVALVRRPARNARRRASVPKREPTPACRACADGRRRTDGQREAGGTARQAENLAGIQWLGWAQSVVVAECAVISKLRRPDHTPPRGLCRPFPACPTVHRPVRPCWYRSRCTACCLGIKRTGAHCSPPVRTGRRRHDSIAHHMPTRASGGRAPKDTLAEERPCRR